MTTFAILLVATAVMVLVLPTSAARPAEWVGGFGLIGDLIVGLFGAIDWRLANAVYQHSPPRSAAGGAVSQPQLRMALAAATSEADMGQNPNRSIS
jgi:hypothetical protein